MAGPETRFFRAKQPAADPCAAAASNSLRTSAQPHAYADATAHIRGTAWHTLQQRSQLGCLAPLALHLRPKLCLRTRAYMCVCISSHLYTCMHYEPVCASLLRLVSAAPRAVFVEHPAAYTPRTCTMHTHDICAPCMPTIRTHHARTHVHAWTGRLPECTRMHACSPYTHTRYAHTPAFAARPKPSSRS